MRVSDIPDSIARTPWRTIWFVAIYGLAGVIGGLAVVVLPHHFGSGDFPVSPWFRNVLIWVQ